MKEPLDKFNQPIRVGCYIAYGHALGRCAGLRVGKVLAIQYKPEYAWQPESERAQIKVQGVDDDWAHTERKLTQHPGYLLYPERMIVVDPKMLPQEYVDLLGGIPIDSPKEEK